MINWKTILKNYEIVVGGCDNIKFIRFITSSLIWLICFTVVTIVIFSLSNLQYIPLEYFPGWIFGDSLIQNGIWIIIITFGIKWILMRLYNRFIGPHFNKFRKNSAEAIKKSGEEIKIKLMKLKKGHILALVLDTILVLFLALLTIAEELLNTDFLSTLLNNLGIDKTGAISTVAGALVLSMITQYKTTLSNARPDTDQAEKQIEEEKKAETVQQVADELKDKFLK